MSNRTANVSSIDAIQATRIAILAFTDEAANAIASLELEARRPVDWLEHDRSQYWPREFRKASDAVSEARLALERCELTSSNDQRRSCYEERKQLEKAKRRLELCEQKIQLVKQWRIKLRKELEDFQVKAAKMKRYLDSDLPRATAMLTRLTESLEHYLQTTIADRSDLTAPTTGTTPAEDTSGEAQP
ncbi:MAG: hypothetical protein RIS70_1791 [Planctomycetota bacterium]